MGGPDLAKDPIDVADVRFVVLEHDERQEGGPAVEARLCEPRELERPHLVRLLLAKVYDVLLPFGKHEASKRKSPRLGNLNVTPGKDVVEISIKPDAKCDDYPGQWHYELSLLKDELEGAEE